ncbi:glycosyl hydrolase [bacterium]|nr:glycosyl hydrolase [bacterium]
MTLASFRPGWLGAVLLLGPVVTCPTPGRSDSLTATVVSVRFDQPGPTALVETPTQPPADIRSRITVSINPQRDLQVIEGVGGAFNENGGEALTHLDATQRLAVLRSLFDPEEGAGFGFCRLPVGASDFAMSAYSLADQPDDYELRHFRLAPDEKFLIPYIAGALSINPQLRFHASPWSPPAWLKTNRSMTGGGSLRDRPEVYRAYATYLRRFVEAYAQRGIRIDRLFVQNEPNIEIKFPSCSMPPRQMITFVVDHLAPEFRAHRLPTEIWAGTFQETRETLYAHTCFENKRFQQAVRGAGFQYSDPVVVQDLQLLHPWLKVMHTEARCQNGRNSLEQAKALFGEVVEAFNAGCTVFTYWNMVLNERQRSTWDWRQNSLITIDRRGKRVRYNPDYVVMSLVARSVRPGATWVLSSSKPQRPLVSFRNPDGSLVSLIWNDGEEALCEVAVGDARTQAGLPAQSFCAIHVRPFSVDR